MRIEGERLIFESGKSIGAHLGIVGLGPNGTIYDGYDGKYDRWWNPETEDLEDELTPEMKGELAEYMIEKWSQFLE